MDNTSNPTVLVIIGVTGDLSRRKLLPAIEKIIEVHAAPEQFKIIGVTRQNIELSTLIDPDSMPNISKNFELFQMDLTNKDDYKRLNQYLSKIFPHAAGQAQFLYYLSVPPQISGPIVELLGANGFSDDQSKLLLEKPFGTDLASARELIEQTRVHFSEDQIYRIDHYIAKEMAQNLIVFREGNSLLKRTWNNNFIERIDITATEKIDIEGRASFYEQTGALKDLVQSHLLQLVALTIMNPPKVGEESTTPLHRLRALKQLNIAATSNGYYASRAQYDGYQNEVGNLKSNIETYVDLTLVSSDPRWTGVPLRIVTGKALSEKKTQICVTYKKDQDYEANILNINFQPSEGFELQLWTKIPGFDWKVEQNSLKHSFSEVNRKIIPDAYEKVLVDAIASNHTLFTTSDEVLESWRILEPVRSAWELKPDILPKYAKGSVAPL